VKTWKLTDIKTWLMPSNSFYNLLQSSPYKWNILHNYYCKIFIDCRWQASIFWTVRREGLLISSCIQAWAAGSFNSSTVQNWFRHMEDRAIYISMHVWLFPRIQMYNYSIFFNKIYTEFAQKFPSKTWFNFLKCYM
jgi:hypothetical protein